MKTYEIDFTRKITYIVEIEAENEEKAEELVYEMDENALDPYFTELEEEAYDIREIE